MSARQIAVLISCSHDAVNRALERFGIVKSASKPGPVPYGWKLLKGKRIPHNGQQKVIRQISLMRERGWSYIQIADKLSLDAGSDGPWYPSKIARILSAAIARP